MQRSSAGQEVANNGNLGAHRRDDNGVNRVVLLATVVIALSPVSGRPRPRNRPAWFRPCCILCSAASAGSVCPAAGNAPPRSSSPLPPFPSCAAPGAARLRTPHNRRYSTPRGLRQPPVQPQKRGLGAVPNLEVQPPPAGPQAHRNPNPGLPPLLPMPPAHVSPHLIESRYPVRPFPALLLLLPERQRQGPEDFF